MTKPKILRSFISKKSSLAFEIGIGYRATNTFTRIKTKHTHKKKRKKKEREKKVRGILKYAAPF